jgi:hypothetical protein
VTLDCATQLPVPATKAWKRASEHALKLALAIERISSVEIVVPVAVIGIPICLAVWVCPRRSHRDHPQDRRALIGPLPRTVAR